MLIVATSAHAEVCIWRTVEATWQGPAAQRLGLRPPELGASLDVQRMSRISSAHTYLTLPVRMACIPQFCAHPQQLDCSSWGGVSRSVSGLANTSRLFASHLAGGLEGYQTQATSSTLYGERL